MAASISFQGVGNQSGAGPYLINFPSVASAAGQERLVALLGTRQGATLGSFGSVTIDGQSASKVGSTIQATDTINNGPIVEFWRATGTSNTNINVGFAASSSMFEGRALLWSLNDAGTLYDSASETHNADGTYTLSLDMDTATGGAAAAALMAYNNASTTATSWTGLTEVFEGNRLYTGDWLGAASANIASGAAPLTVTASLSVNDHPAVAALAISFNPSTGTPGITAPAIRIKRRTGGAAGAPSSLANAELAYNETSGILYIGTGDSGSGVATSIVAIGGAGAYQPLDADLTSIAGYGGTGAWLYRSAANTWSAVTVGTGLSFSGGTLACTVSGGGTVTTTGSPASGEWAQFSGATSITGVATASAPWVLKAGDTMTGALTVTPGAGASGLQINATGTQGRIIGTGSGANVDVFFAAKGTGQHAFYTNGFTTAQVYISSANTFTDTLYLSGGDGAHGFAYNLAMGSGNSVKTQTPATTSNDRSIATTGFVRAFVAALASKNDTNRNPTGTTSTTGVMMGLGTNWTITPGATGRLMVVASGNIQTTTAAGTPAVHLRYGTGTAPTNGAASTGTALGSIRSPSTGTATWMFPWSQNGVLTGLSIGTAYWFDLLVTAGAGTTATVNSCDISIIEF